MMHHVVWHILANISENLIASIIRVINSEITPISTRMNILEEDNLYLYCHVNLKSHQDKILNSPSPDDYNLIQIDSPKLCDLLDTKRLKHEIYLLY